ncbi:MAG TPA: purine-nucleoside phosphorylase [Gemmatimonadaceae bacterium]|nr:purine-nucleoside phosphorylase [Gemmatimonadaceae bacterium]
MTSSSVADGPAKAAEAVRGRLDRRAPRVMLILGSGLGHFADAVENAVSIPFDEIPGFPATTVHGHGGRLVAGAVEGVQVIVQAGRFHLYEGHAADTTVFPVRMAHALGARTLFVSNASGGIRRTFRAGDLMLIRDQINLMWRNPLIGPVQRGEERFPDMSSPFDPELLALMRESALAVGVPAVEGVYCGLLGPTYETPAEVRMLELIGADAVGMSTVPEVLAARALGMRVAGVSCVTNVAAGYTSEKVSHDEVLAVAARVAESFGALVREWIRRLA